MLDSDSRKKIIIAGPGTGKSFIFQQVCKRNIANGQTKNLALSFINELVEDLSVDLYNLADVRTLHSFAFSKIKGKKKIFLDLPDIVNTDYEIETGKKVDFRESFSNLTITSSEAEFYRNRVNYYNYFCPSSSVYFVSLFFEQNRSRIPDFSQILVDEFQDFNKLEVKLIDLLSEKSPVLIVGDDDQSLYSWKNATPEEVRVRHAAGEFSVFELPFCSRCTEVIIKSFDDVVRKAISSGFLGGRVNKGYRYFPNEKKDLESSENPKLIVCKKVYQKSVADFIRREIEQILNPKDSNSVLIVCSSRGQIKDLRQRLQQKGFQNIQVADSVGKDLLIEALGLLLEDRSDNLGWRIISQEITEEEEFKKILKEAMLRPDLAFSSFLTVESRKTVRSLLAIFRKIVLDQPTSQAEKQAIFDFFGLDIVDIAVQQLRESFSKKGMQKNPHKNIQIRITNILGSKGLTYDYVFLVNFDDKYLIGKELSDEGICKFLVALTRARKRVYICTGESKLPTFVEWIDRANIEVR